MHLLFRPSLTLPALPPCLCLPSGTAADERRDRGARRPCRREEKQAGMAVAARGGTRMGLQHLPRTRDQELHAMRAPERLDFRSTREAS